MKNQGFGLMHSKFFTPAFNSAIFDGPVRIYFAQFHEALALKVYFHLQSRFKDQMSVAKDISKKNGRNLLIMIYPTKENFEYAFEGQVPEGALFAIDELASDSIIGVCGPLEDDLMESLYPLVCDTLSNWKEDEELIEQPREASF